jgi:hypothetical protein
MASIGRGRSLEKPFKIYGKAQGLRGGTIAGYIPRFTLEVRYEYLNDIAKNLITKKPADKYRDVFGPVFQKIEKGLFMYAEQQFRTEGRYGGKKWRSLTAMTQRQFKYGLQGEIDKKQVSTRTQNVRYKDGSVDKESYAYGGYAMRGGKNILRVTNSLYKVATGRADSAGSGKGKLSIRRTTGPAQFMSKGGQVRARFGIEAERGWKWLHNTGYMANVFGTGVKKNVYPRVFWPTGQFSNPRSPIVRYLRENVSARLLEQMIHNRNTVPAMNRGMEHLVESGKIFR